MSEEILKALMQMFAILIRQDPGGHERYNTFVQQFLSSQLSPALLPQYLQLYEDFKAESRERDKEKKLTPVIDSVRILSICKRINKTLNSQQKVILMVRLLELIGLEGTPAQRRLDIANTAAEVFRIDPNEYRQMQVFIDSARVNSEPDPSCMLIICSPKEEHCGFCHQPYGGLPEGLLYILNLSSVNLQFARYKGQSDLQLNGLNMLSGKVYLFAPGSIIRVPGGKPLFYSDVLSRMRQDVIVSPIRFSAQNISIQYEGTRAGLKPVTIREKEGRLVGIMGGSGSGKSTLLNILSGIQKPDTGRISINGLDIYLDRAALRGVTGYIPQDDLLMEDLSVYENLYFNARLCFAGLEDHEVRERVNRVLDSLGLSAVAELKVGNPVQKTISGGQRKRLNIGIELLREPSVLFVDEPTSGLSSRDSENVMDLLRELALRGKLIFVVIHQPSSDIYKLFDRMMIMDMEGVLVYDGNPVEAVEYFRKADQQADFHRGSCPNCGHVTPEHIFNILEARIVDEYGNYTAERKRKPEDWHKLYLEHRESEEWKDTTQKPLQVFQAPGRWKQALIYAGRDLRAKMRNRQYLLLNLLEAPLLAFILSFIIRYTSGGIKKEYSFSENDNVPAFLFMCIIVSIFMGLTVSAEEIFRDRRLLRREKLLRMSRFSYLISKTCILFMLSGIQAFLFTSIGNKILGIEDMLLPYFILFFSVACLSNMMGLVISSTMNSVVNIYILVPLLIIPQMILGGAMFSYEKLNRNIGGGYRVPVIASLMPSRWAFEAIAVKQFKDNAYGKLVYEWAAAESRASWRQEYLYPELVQITDEALKADKKGNVIEKRRLLRLLRSGLELLLQTHQGVAGILPANPAAWKEKEALKIKTQLAECSAYDQELFLRAGAKKERVLEQGLNTSPERGNMQTLMKKSHNLRLAEVVRRLEDGQKILRTDEEILCLMDPVYVEPRCSKGLSWDAHFFAPCKFVFGLKISTFKFNLLILWSMTFVLFLFLYFNILKAAIQGFSKTAQRVSNRIKSNHVHTQP